MVKAALGCLGVIYKDIYRVIFSYLWICFLQLQFKFFFFMENSINKQFISFEMFIILSSIMRSLTVPLCPHWRCESNLCFSFPHCIHSLLVRQLVYVSIIRSTVSLFYLIIRSTVSLFYLIIAPKLQE